jgi:nitrite reductase (NADH) small subunit
VPKLIKVAQTQDIPPGEAKVYYVRGREIAVFNIKGRFYAVDNLCPHQGGPLVAGEVKEEVVTCPWHKWQFHLPTGLSPVNSSVSARIYPVELVNDEVRIRMVEGESEAL